MVRELIIGIYIFLFKLFFKTFKILPQKEKTTFVASFGDNIYHIAEALSRRTKDHQIIILKKRNCKLNFDKIEQAKVYDFESLNIIHQIISIFHMSTSKFVFIDNYHGFLAAADFKKNVKCVQLWHAAGAIKKFGLKDPSIYSRSSTAKDRFQKVYNQQTHIVVGSKKMVSIFREGFGLNTQQRILRTGIPRTDFFFNERKKQEATDQVYKWYPDIKSKKVILYAPTFRDDQLSLSELHIDLGKLYKELGESHVLLLRLHPAVEYDLDNRFPGFVLDVSDYPSINHLLLVTDYLITDYSSIPFEYSLLGKPMIFYSFDLEEYQKTRGFWEDFENNAPGPIVKSTNEIITIIKENNFDFGKIDAFSREWNEFSKGNSSSALISELYKS